MKLVQKLTYKLAKPMTMLAIAGATLFTGCSKDNDDNNNFKTRVIKFNAGDLSPLGNLDGIKASADSAEIVEIIFQVDEKYIYGWEGIGMKYFYEHSIVPAFQAAKNKGKGSGMFKRVDADEKDAELEQKFKALGFKGFQYLNENQH